MQLLCLTGFSVISVVSVISEFSAWLPFTTGLAMKLHKETRHKKLIKKLIHDITRQLMSAIQ